MPSRPYDADRDLDAAHRIFREVGWGKDTEADRRATALHLGVGTTLVAEVGGEAECLVSSHDGDLRYLEQDLPLCVVSSAATSRLARRRGLATRLTAEALARDASEKGAAVAVLGVFEQGFYERLGFGAGAYDRIVHFDPADLAVDRAPRTPLRLGPQDHARAHAGRASRRRAHGSIALGHPEVTHADMLQSPGGFGFGYAEPPTGALSHHLWGATEAPAGGPYAVRWLAYRTRDEFLELLGLLRTLGDQVRLVRLHEPPGIQLQDLLHKPFRRQQVSRGSRYEASIRAEAWWQVRILDLEVCLAAVRAPSGADVAFNLLLSDPVADRLPEALRERWSGVAGEYLVRLAERSAVERRPPDPALPTLRTSVGTLSRLWLGVGSASALAFTCSDLEAPAGLLADLDGVLGLPAPALDWGI